jgi:tetratricopeptide (TPR) repeat protein
MSGFSRYLKRLALAAALAIAAGAAAQDDLLAKARQLLSQRKGAEAYQLLRSAAETHAGNPDFDLLYGMSAIDAGRPAEATFALERVLDVQPNNPAAQAELGRAYYEMGENDAAKAQFERVRGEKLPPTVQQNVERYLAAIDTRRRAARTAYSAYVEIGAGYDSNVNSATDQEQVLVAGAIALNLLEPSIEQDSPFWDVNAGFGFNSALTPMWALFGGINFAHHALFADTTCQTAFGLTSCSTSSADGNFGVQYSPTEQDRYRLSVYGQKFYVGSDENRDLGAINGEYLRTLGKSDQVSAFMQYGMFRFPGQHSRDVDRYVGGAGWGHAFAGGGAPVLFVSAYGGTEDDVEDNPGGIARDLLGARIGGEYSMTGRARAFGSVSYQKSWYDSPTPLFGPEDRDDDYVYVDGGVRYAVTKLISVLPEVRYTNNDSNVPIDDFERWEALVSLRSDF